MAKRKTIQTMTAEERLQVRKEMVRQATEMIWKQNPSITPGALRVKAYKFVESSLSKEFQKQ